MNKFWTRLFIIAAAVLLLLFFSNDFGLIDIQKTAVVAAIGIDAAEQEGFCDVTAQIAVPDQSGSGKASNVTVKGASTVNDAITELNRKTGWYPTLVHCKLLLLGEKVADNDVLGVLDFFLRSNFIDDSCLVAVCEERAEDTLRASSPVGELTAVSISKVLSSTAQKTGAVSVMILRDFAKGYYSDAASGYLPFLSVKREAQSENGGSGGQGQQAFAPAGALPGAAEKNMRGTAGGEVYSKDATCICAAGKNGICAMVKKDICAAAERARAFSIKGPGSIWQKLFPRRDPLPIGAPCAAEGDNKKSSGGQSGGQKSGSDTNADVFDASKTMLFYRGKRAAVLETEETLAFNLADTSTDLAYGNVEVMENGAPVVYCLKIKISGKKIKTDVRGGAPVLTFRIRANAQVSDVDSSQGIVDVAQTARVPAHVLCAAEEKFAAMLGKVLDKCVQSNSDIFGIAQSLHRFHPKEYKRLKDGLLEKVRPAYDIQFETLH